MKAEPFAALGHGTLRGRFAYAIALLLFGAVLVIAWQRLPNVRIGWAWLGVTALLTPLTLFLNSLEYRMAGHLLSQRVPAGEAVRVTLLSTAANLLPLPGAVLVRSQALRDRGSDYAGAIRSTAAVGVGWLGTALLLAGSVQWIAGGGGLGPALLALGLGTLAATAWMLRAVPFRRGWMGSLVVLECLFVGVASLRLLSVFQALGVPASFAQAVVITLAGALASAAGVFPGGLGLRELLAGGLAALVRVPSAAGALAAALDRIVGLAVLSLAAAILLARSPRSPVREDGAVRGSFGAGA